MTFNKTKIHFYSKKKQGEQHLTDYLQVKEFACHDGSDGIYIDNNLVYIVNEVRKHFGKPIYINSGYRTESYNRYVGGVKNSYHIHGMAADVWLKGVPAQKIYDWLCLVFPNYYGVILYKNQGFVHIDTREKPYREVRK